MMSAGSTSPEELQALYRELILDHARSPRNFGKLKDATHQAEGINPLCGDKLKLYIDVNDDRISGVQFEGSGCAISVASASLLTETVVGMTTAEAIQQFTVVVDTLTGNASSADLGKLTALLGVREFPSRVKCATLAWHALSAAINEAQQPATTE
ncbi:MAG: SUF system NifU family Fe-S cluster assembly protein [Woeseiaceae bacterium]|nr:SUF system NifU family Fe-S cluster assembly protein [Woeseiaceae bacterium]